MGRTAAACLLGWLLLWGGLLPAAFADPASSAAAAIELDLKPFEGQRIAAVEFSSTVNLTGSELRKSSALKAGDPLTERAVRESIERFYRRGIFEHVDVRIAQTEEGLVVQFVLCPKLVIELVEFRGNYTLTEKQLRRLVRIRNGDDFSIDVLIDAKKRLLDGYRKAGHYAAEVSVRVAQQSVARWATVTFDIVENYRSEFSKAELDAPLPEELSTIRRRLTRDAVGLPASEENADRLKRDLLLAVRREGFLQASIRDGLLHYDEATHDVELSFTGDVGEPASITFTGNTVFSADELLVPLRMDSRTVPFTPNALITLARAIEKMYQQQGYYFATAEATKLGIENGRQQYRIEIDERQSFTIRSVTFDGNVNVSTSKLEELIETLPEAVWPFRPWRPGFLVKELLAADTERIRQYYETKGYLEAIVSDAIVVDQEGQKFEIVFHVTEGKAQSITSLDLEWTDVLSGARPEPNTGEPGRVESGKAESEGVESDGAQKPAAGFNENEGELLLVRSELQTGQPFDRDALRDEQRRLYNEVLALGYPNAAVELRGDAKEGTVRYVISPGTRVRIGTVQLRGNAQTHDFVLQRELLFAPGELWKSELLESSKQNLAGLGYFRSVEVEPLDGALDEEIEDVAVTVDERETGRIGLGGSFTTEDGFHASGELGQRNLFGRGMRFLLGVDSYIKTGSRIFDAGSARASFTKPRVLSLGSDFSTEVFLQSSVKLIDQFSYDRVGAEVDLTTPWSESVRSVMGVIGFTERLYDVEPDVILGENDVGSTQYTFLRSSIDVDLRDNRYAPRSGARTQLDARYATRALGSDIDLLRLSLQQSFLFPIGKRIVWANRFGGEYVEPFGDAEVVPLGQRVFLGGRNTLRGFSRDSVGPRGFDLNVVGGDSSVNATTEGRYDFTESLTGVLFLDAGQAYLRNKGTFTGDSLDISDLRFSPGFGAHYQTPIGPIRAEYGFALNREYDERFGRINVSIGTGF